MACAACQQPCQQAVLAVDCGHSFCAGCARQRSECPVDQQPLRQLVDNIALQQHLDNQPARCPHCRRLCLQKQLHAHSQHCLARMLPCINSCGAKPMPASVLLEHLKQCAMAQCLYRTRGCTFAGTLMQARSHAETCDFAGDVSMAEEIILERTQHLQQELQAMLTSASHLSQQISALEALQAPPDFEMPFSFRCLGAFRGHEGPIWAVASHNSLLFSSSSDESIKVWDTVRPSCVRTLPCPRGVVHAITVTESHLVTGDSQGWLHRFRLDTFEIESMRQLPPGSAAEDALISALAYSAGRLCVATYGCIQLLDVNTLEVQHKQADLQHWVRAMCLGPDGVLYTASGRRITGWSTSTLDCIRKLDLVPGAVRALTVTRTHIIAGTHNQNIHAYDINTLEHTFELTGHVGAITSIMASPGGKYIFSASLDGRIKVWDTSKRLVVQTLNRHRSAVNVLIWHGEQLVSGGEDADLHLYKITDQAPTPIEK